LQFLNCIDVSAFALPVTCEQSYGAIGFALFNLEGASKGPPSHCRRHVGTATARSAFAQENWLAEPKLACGAGDVESEDRVDSSGSLLFG